MITQEEKWALNILTASAAESQQELQRRMAARNSYIKDKEEKYNAVYNPVTGEFIPKPEKKLEEP